MAPWDYLVLSGQNRPLILMNRSHYRMGLSDQTVMLDQMAMLAQEEIALHFLH
jgi:hypothetical protein